MFQQLVLFTSMGTLELKLAKEIKVQITLNEQECDLLRAMCERFYGERQMTIAEAVRNPIPQLADFSEVPV